ncbi:MAG TPA: class I SAM-dependent methyltransferase, partial [Blastocatellia bacterium]|nr:class I SAM-dependent methyltransferase [Blastocatellia bacterium]
RNVPIADRETLTAAAFNPLAHPVCLAAPLRLTPLTAWQEHIPFAMFLVAALRPRMLVELGTEAGDSYCAFCQTVEALDLDARCYAVDTWRGDAHAGGYSENVLEELRAHHDPLYSRFSTLIQSTFDEALAHFGDGSIDLLHIDGFHAYESASHDFETWRPKVSRGGVILLHDINVRERGFGVSRLWEEIKRRYPTFEFHHGHGLGVAAAGGRVAPGLRALFDADEQEAARVRRFFSHLGRRLTLEREYEKRRQTIETLRRQGEARDAERQTWLRQVESAEAALQSLTADIAAQKAAWQSLTETLEAREADARELRAELEAKGETLSAAEGECRRLRDEAAHVAESSSLQIAHLEAQSHERGRLLAEREAQLQRITRTLGWRLLSRYGRVKYGLLLPVYHGMRGVIERVTRRSYEPTVEPMHDVRPLDAARWQSTGSDPQFNLRGRWPEGWAEITLDLATEHAVSGHARLYVDRGAGYNERDSIDLGMAGGTRRVYTYFGPEVVAMRFDPFESAGVFQIKRLRLTPVSARKAQRRDPTKTEARRGALSEFLRFASSRADSFRRKNGRAPRLTELPGAVRRTLRAWKLNHPDRPPFYASPFAHAPHADVRAAEPQVFQVPEPLDAYDAWLEVNQWNARRAALLEARLAALAEPPLLSVVMPVYNAPPEFLERAIRSVVAQAYANWELCVADDASTDPAVK